MRENKTYGILSLNIYQADNNWGSVLQSWALQKKLTQLHIDNVIINYCPKRMKTNTARFPFLRNFPFHFKRLIKYGISDLASTNNFIQRDEKFKAFIQKNYVISQYCTEKSLSKIKVFGYIVGSDVVWHETVWNGYDPAFFCDLPCMKNKHNISYAPSIATNGFSKRTEEKLPKLLSNFACLSVREPSIIPYLKTFTTTKIIGTIDPTLLLYASDYSKFILGNLINSPYVLVYCVYQESRIIERANQYAEMYNMKIVIVKCCPEKRYKISGAYYMDNVGIEEWLSLFYYSSMVFTNSFHACVFSILFHKSFVAFQNDFARSKIFNLLNQLDLDNCLASDQDISNYKLNENNIDYKKVDKKLEEMREKSVSFLIESLLIEDNK